MNIELEQVEVLEVTDDALELASYCNLSTGIPRIPNSMDSLGLGAVSVIAGKGKPALLSFCVFAIVEQQKGLCAIRAQSP